MNVLVLGAGGWGIGLALVASRNKHNVTLWSFDPAELEDLRLHNQNKLRLPGVFLPRAIRLTGDMSEAAQADMSVLDKAKNMAAQAVEAVRAWLYEGVEVNSAEQVTGSLVEVTVGMRNDDYAEITSGVKEGDIVLYKAAESSGNSMLSMMMGGMGGGMGGRR